MKITKRQLKQIIQEEYERINEENGKDCISRISFEGEDFCLEDKIVRMESFALHPPTKSNYAGPDQEGLVIPFETDEYTHPIPAVGMAMYIKYVLGARWADEVLAKTKEN